MHKDSVLELVRKIIPPQYPIVIQQFSITICLPSYQDAQFHAGGWNHLRNVQAWAHADGKVLIPFRSNYMTRPASKDSIDSCTN